MFPSESMKRDEAILANAGTIQPREFDAESRFMEGFRPGEILNVNFDPAY